VPDNDEQRTFLAATDSAFFERGQKERAVAILTAMARGRNLGDSVYETCAGELERLTDTWELDVDYLPPMPPNWFDFKAKHAKQHNWLQEKFVAALLNRDNLMKHCKVHMARLERKQGAPRQQAEYQTGREMY